MTDAERYAKLALACRDENAELASLYLRLSDEEMGHMDALHRAAAQLIGKYRREHGEPPEAMLAVYNYLHDKHIEQARAVRVLQEMCRSS